MAFLFGKALKAAENVGESRFDFKHGEAMWKMATGMNGAKIRLCRYSPVCSAAIIHAPILLAHPLTHRLAAILSFAALFCCRTVGRRLPSRECPVASDALAKMRQ